MKDAPNDLNQRSCTQGRQEPPENSLTNEADATTQERLVKAFAPLIHIHRDVNAANCWALLCDTSVRIAPTADNSVFVCGSEGLQRSVVAFDLSRMV